MALAWVARKPPAEISDDPAVAAMEAAMAHRKAHNRSGAAGVAAMTATTRADVGTH